MRDFLESESKQTLQSIDDTLKRIEKILLNSEQKAESTEEFYKKHGIIQTFA